MYKIQGAESCGGSRKLSMYKHGEDGTASTIESLRFQPALQQCVPRGTLPMTHTNQMAVQMSPESLRSHIYRAGSIPCHAGVHEYQLGASWHRQMKVVVRPRGPVSRPNTVLHAEKKNNLHEFSASGCANLNRLNFAGAHRVSSRWCTALLLIVMCLCSCTSQLHGSRRGSHPSLSHKYCLTQA